MRGPFSLGRRTALMLATAITCASGASTAAAQQNRDATVSAVDAFGETVGVEQIGLYNLSEIRGFNPQNSGAERIDGFYFARAGNIEDPAVDHRSVSVGVNAAPLNYPSPSGIINVHLKTFAPGDRLLELSLNSYAWFSPTLDANFSLASNDGRVGVAGGAQFLPAVTYPDGSKTEEYYVGLVPGWRISDSVRAHALISYGHANVDRGRWSDVLSGASLPPAQSTNVLLPPHAASASVYTVDVGLFLDGVFSNGWRAAASAIYSAGSFSPLSFTSFDFGGGPLVGATLEHFPEHTKRAIALEARLSRDFQFIGADHQVTGALRYRHREAIDSDPTIVDLGTVDARHPVFPDLPQFSDNGLRSLDAIDQEVASLDYAGIYWGRVQLRAGVDLTRRAERFRPLAGASTSGSRDFTFPHASIIYSLNDNTALFASYARGLEDSGVAPNFAVNGNQVLPPAVAEATELGLRQAISPNLTLIVVGFEVQKPTPGLQADGVFGLVGEERHRGLEASLTGQLTPLTRVVLGAVTMEQSLSGPLVSSAQVGSHPVGTAPTVVAANVVQTLPFARDWSVDAQLRWTDGKYIDTANLARSNAISILNIGLRRDFHIGQSSAELRLVATNVLNTRDWDVQTDGSIAPVNRPTIWGTFTTRFGAQ